VSKSEVQVARAQIESFEKAMDQYRLDKRRYPTAEEGLQALAPYLKKTLPNDPWDRPYVYRTPGAKGEYEIVSYGRDGKAGGSGDDADIGLN
jgi:general secretion pathway protein G